MSDTPTENADVSELAEQVVAELESGRYGDKFVLSRRQLVALAGSGLSVAALMSFGVSEAQAQEAVGAVGTESEPIDVYGDTVQANNAEIAGTATAEALEAEEAMIAGQASEYHFESVAKTTVEGTISLSYAPSEPFETTDKFRIILRGHGSDNDFTEFQITVNGKTSEYQSVIRTGDTFSESSEDSHFSVTKGTSFRGVAGDYTLTVGRNNVLIFGNGNSESFDLPVLVEGRVSSEFSPAEITEISIDSDGDVRDPYVEIFARKTE